MGTSKYIDSLQDIPAGAGFSDLRCHFETGRSILISGSGRDKRFGYRSGIETDIGDIEISVWREAVSQLIDRDGERPIYQALLSYVADEYPWWHTNQERELEVLNLHCCRIFENPHWVDHNLFWKNTVQRHPPARRKSEMKKRTGALVYHPASGRMDIRFNLDSYYGGLHCGECLEVMVDGRWTVSRIEKAEDWYLVGIQADSISGLIVRI